MSAAGGTVLTGAPSTVTMKRAGLSRSVVVTVASAVWPNQ